MHSLSLNTDQQFVGNLGGDADVQSLNVGAGLGESLSPEMRALLNFSEELVMPGLDQGLRKQLWSEIIVTPGSGVRFAQNIVSEFLVSELGEGLGQDISAETANTSANSRVGEAEGIIAEMEATNQLVRLWEAMLEQPVGNSAAVVPATGKPSDYEESIMQSLGLAA
jgi:hypothetical protein